MTPEHAVPEAAARGAAAARDLTRDECLEALTRTSLGRIAVSDGALPLILPVNYALEGGSVVFRTRQGGLLDRACRNTIVAFEVDDFEPLTGIGWSVVIVGVANVLYAGEWLRAMELGLTSAGAAEGSVFVKVVPGTISGRAIEPGPPAARGSAS